MERLKRFPWRRLLALVLAAAVLVLAAGISRGDKMYVGVDKSSPDSVVLSEPDLFMGEPVGKLMANQEVETVGKPNGEYIKIRATIDGKKVEGWVKQLVLRKQPLESQPRVTESGGAQHSAQAGKGLNAEIEKDMRQGSGQMDKALKRVDDFEATRNRLMGGDAKEPDPAKQQQHYKSFGKEGQLR
ncbi:MAG: SH3 domain-containing protein [Planctomycetes bacterium]|nr:SH3 domain-containing protein [Planctomycetota bacterium]MCW8135081.1 SH3 domain-containing protein [Planctomycetota bacterium]